MKVLSMAWTIYDSRIRYFCKNCTGAGMVVKNICEYIGRKHQSYLFVGRHQLPAMKLGNIWIVDTSIVEYDCNMELDSGERHLRVMTKAFSKAIDEIEPEIVNFHGIGILMQRCINICREKKIPYVYTEHLYISIWRSIEKY